MELKGHSFERTNDYSLITAYDKGIYCLDCSEIVEHSKLFRVYCRTPRVLRRWRRLSILPYRCEIPVPTYIIFQTAVNRQVLINADITYEKFLPTRVVNSGVPRNFQWEGM